MTTPTIFDGFRIISPEIARGGAGVVHLAIDPRGKHVALKVLNREALLAKAGKKISTNAQEESVEREKNKFYDYHVDRFKEEYEILVGLKHPNVAQVYSIGFSEGKFYMAQEFIDGKPIAEFVRGLKPADMLPLFVQALDGLDFIHRCGLVHLDIKSENILVQHVDGNPVVKIIDFGLAMNPEDYTGAFIGSVSSMAPEVAMGIANKVDSRADLFSIGVVMYQCITWGDLPFARPGKGNRDAIRSAIEREKTCDPPSLAHESRKGHVPEFLDKIVMRLLAKEPDERFYGNARAVINALMTRAPDLFKDMPETRGAYLAPEDDRHIGRTNEQREMISAIEEITSGRQSKPDIFMIVGDVGIGKSHLLGKMRAHAMLKSEKVFLSHIEMPADEAQLESFARDITAWASEGAKPLALFIDDVDWLLSKKGHWTEGQAKAANSFMGLLAEHSGSGDSPSGEGSPPSLVIMTADRRNYDIIKNILSEEQASEIFEMPLKPLSEDDIGNYLASTCALKNRKVPKEWVRMLFELTSGIPAELVSHLEDLNNTGLLFGLNGEIVISPPMQESARKHVSVPLPTEARLLSIYRRLQPEEREIVEAMAVWGMMGLTPPCSADFIMEVAGSAFTMTHLKRMESLGVVKKSEEGYALLNNYFSLLVRVEIGAENIEALHDAVKTYLAANFPHFTDAILLHTGFGSRRGASVVSLAKLAKSMIDKEGRTRAAHELLGRALSRCAIEERSLKIFLRTKIAECLYYDGKLRQALEVLNKAVSSVRDIKGKGKGLRGFLGIRLSLTLLKMGLHDEAIAAAEKGIEEAVKGSTHHPLLLNCKALAIYNKALEGTAGARALLDEALSIFNQSKALEETIPDANKGRVSNNMMGLVMRAKGMIREAAAELSMNLEKKEHNIFSRMSLAIALADTLRMTGEFEQALKFARQAQELARASGQGEWLMYAHGVMANAYHDMNRFDDAIAENQRYLAASGCIEDREHHRQTAIRLWINMGHCCKEKHDWDKAIAYFESAIEAKATGVHLMSALSGLGEVEHTVGDFNMALELFGYAKAAMNGLPDNVVTRAHRFRIAVTEAKIHIAQGDIAAASALIPEIKKLAEGDESRQKEIVELENSIKS